jgi:myo-inositol-1(or 4)-monophosphatase
MDVLQPEKDFFNNIAPRILALVLSFNGTASVSVQKSHGDYSTEVDVAVENLIVDEIQQRFPKDAILAEEGRSQTTIPDGRIWIIDPICGTTNIGRGMKNFCTNIALVDHMNLIASCVIDHSTGDVLWSVGNKKVYINDQLFEYIQPDDDFGVVVDVDFGSLDASRREVRNNFSKTIKLLLTSSDYMITSLNSSLAFAYTSIGKLDGFINSYNHPWDICAASFLLQQTGCTITALDGEPWTITTVGAVGAYRTEIHHKLLRAYQESL